MATKTGIINNEDKHNELSRASLLIGEKENRLDVFPKRRKSTLFILIAESSKQPIPTNGISIIKRIDMAILSKTIRHLIEPLAYRSKMIGYISFYLRARELGFKHGRIIKTINYIRQ